MDIWTTLISLNKQGQKYILRATVNSTPYLVVLQYGWHRMTPGHLDKISMYSSYCQIPFSAGTICLPYVIRTYRPFFRSSSKLPCYEMLTYTNINQVSWPINYRYSPLIMCAEIAFYCRKVFAEFPLVHVNGISFESWPLTQTCVTAWADR